MAAEDERLRFSFELVDEVTETATEITRSVDRADDKVVEYTTDAQRAKQATNELDRATHATQLRLVTQMAAIGSISGAVNALSGGLQGLGLVSDETAQDLAKVSSAFSVIKGTAQGLTAVKALMATLNAQTAINASLSSYLAVLKNPAMMAGVAIAGGAALGVAGAYLMTNNSSTTNNQTTNITVQDTTPARATNGIIRVVEGGAL